MPSGLPFPRASSSPPARLHQAKFALGGLIVDEDRMAHNLGISQGPDRGRGRDDGHGARTSVVSRRTTSCTTPAAPSTSSGGTLAEALAAIPEVTEHFDRAAIDRLTDPANYLGLAPQMVDRAIDLSRALGA